MSLWAAIAGGANEYLRQSQAKEEEDRFKKKQELLAKLQQEQEIAREGRKEKARIVSTTPDYDNKKIIETLASGETRELDMPEAMQMEGIRNRVMGQREQLLKDADRERGLQGAARKEELENRRMALDERRTAAYEESLANRGQPRTGSAPSPIKASDYKNYVGQLESALSSYAEASDEKPEIAEYGKSVQVLVEEAEDALQAGDIATYMDALRRIRMASRGANPVAELPRNPGLNVK